MKPLVGIIGSHGGLSGLGDPRFAYVWTSMPWPKWEPTRYVRGGYGAADWTAIATTAVEAGGKVAEAVIAKGGKKTVAKTKKHAAEPAPAETPPPAEAGFTMPTWGWVGIVLVVIGGIGYVATRPSRKAA